jgi:hypothetical protein
MIGTGDLVVFLAATGIIVAYFVVLRRVLERTEARPESTAPQSVAPPKH